MIEFRLSAEALGRTRFGYSPLAEVACSLRVLGADQPGPLLRRWADQTRARVQPSDLALLRAVVPPGHFAPDLLFAWSTDPKVTITDQLDDLAAVSSDRIRSDLDEVWGTAPLPSPAQDLLDSPAPARLLAQVIDRYWQVAVAPHWGKIRAVIDDDVAYRAARVVSGGLYDLLADLHPEASLRSGCLHIDKPHHQDATYDQAELALHPSVFVWPNLIIGHQAPGYFELIYAARGVGRVWETTAGAGADDALAALIGKGRATILARLAAPMTTTQLAALLGLSPGTISQHLSVLRRSGLLTSWRSGRAVLYKRTDLADAIIDMQHAASDRSRT